MSGSDPSPVRFLPSTLRVTAPGLPSLRVTARRSVHVFEVPVPTMPSKMVAPPGVVRSVQQGSLTAVTEITTAGAWAFAGGAGVVFAAGCLCAVAAAVRAAAAGAASGASRHEVIGDQAGERREDGQQRNAPAPMRPAAPGWAGGGWMARARWQRHGPAAGRGWRRTRGPAARGRCPRWRRWRGCARVHRNLRRRRRSRPLRFRG